VSIIQTNWQRSRSFLSKVIRRRLFALPQQASIATDTPGRFVEESGKGVLFRSGTFVAVAAFAKDHHHRV
jgi:hypothetical protein